MHYKILATYISAAIASLVPLVVSAQQPSTYDNPITLQINNQPVDSVQTFFGALVNGFIAIMTPIIVVAIIYAGFLFVTAQGDTSKLSKARFVLTWTLVGAALLLGAMALSLAIQGTVVALR